MVGVDDDDEAGLRLRLVVMVLGPDEEEKAALDDATSTQGRGRPAATRARRYGGVWRRDRLRFPPRVRTGVAGPPPLLVVVVLVAAAAAEEEEEAAVARGKWCCACASSVARPSRASVRAWALWRRATRCGSRSARCWVFDFLVFGIWFGLGWSSVWGLGFEERRTAGGQHRQTEQKPPHMPTEDPPTSSRRAQRQLELSRAMSRGAMPCVSASVGSAPACRKRRAMRAWPDSQAR